MKELIAYIFKFGHLSEREIEFVSQRGKMLRLRKDEYLAEAGKISKLIGFLINGIIRVWEYNSAGEEITLYFVDKDHLHVNRGDANTEIIHSQYFQAITDCELIVFSKMAWKEIANTIIDWDKIILKICIANHIEKLKRRSLLVTQDATTRYLEFIETYSTLSNHIPLAYIASYLGITQQSLSRIRKNIR